MVNFVSHKGCSRNYYFGTPGSPSLNFIEACVPSQKGLLLDCPQRHRTTRFLTSKVSPFSFCTGIPPHTARPPLTFIDGSSMSARLGSYFGSKGFCVLLSQALSRPFGHILASRMVRSRAVLSSDCPTRFHTLPFASQKRAKTQ